MSNDDLVNKLKLDKPLEPPTLTFGEKAVGLTGNFGLSDDLTLVKREFATLLDLLNNLEKQAYNSHQVEAGQMLSVAITEAITSFMWAQKSVTWKY